MQDRRAGGSADTVDIQWLAADLTEEEERFWLAWYVSLTNVQRIAIDCVIDTGDLRLVFYLWESLAQHAQECQKAFLP